MEKKEETTTFRDVPFWVWMVSLMGLASVVASVGDMIGVWEVSPTAALISIVSVGAYMFGAMCAGGGNALAKPMIDAACYKAIADALSNRR